MVARVEGIPQVSLLSEPPVPSKEGKIIPKNRFVDFIQKNQEGFDNLATATRLLREEERGWRASPVIERLVESWMNTRIVSVSGHISSGEVEVREIRRVRNDYRRAFSAIIFDRSADALSVLKKQIAQTEFKLSPEMRREHQGRMLSVEEAKSEYIDATRPFLEEIQEEKKRLFARFWDYLGEDHRNFFDFVEFLKDRKNPERNRSRVFLEALAQIESAPKDPKRPNKIEQIIREREQEALENPRMDIVMEFSEKMISLPQIRRVKGWLSFANAMRGVQESREITDEEVANRLGYVLPSFWPDELRDEFVRFVASKFTSAITTLRQELIGFNPKIHQGPRTGFVPQMDSAKRNHAGQNGKNGTSDEQVIVSASVVEEEQKQQYAVGIIQKVEDSRGNLMVLLDEGDVVSYLRKQADKFAPGDVRIARDFERIRKNIQEDPYGLGAKKLRGKTIAIDGEPRIPLRSMDPVKRSGLTLEHPESYRIRFVFVIKDGTVAIEGIYTHDEYDKRFG